VILVAISCKSQATAIEMGLGIGPVQMGLLIISFSPQKNSQEDC